jgi:hypothetical protein
MSTRDWLPHKRDDLIALSKVWQAVLVAAKVAAWNIPAAEVAALRTLTAAAEEALAAEQGPTRTSVGVAQCKAAFAALAGKMRLFKSHYFLTPPLTETDYVSLWIKPRNGPRIPVPPPVALAKADVSYLGIHQLVLRLRPTPDSPPDPHHADYGYRVYYGILPHGGASVEAATGPKRELMKEPVSGEELPHSRFTRRKKEHFDFAQEDRGKTIFFCVRFENAKGEPGRWGPLFSAIIP